MLNVDNLVYEGPKFKRVESHSPQVLSAMQPPKSATGIICFE